MVILELDRPREIRFGFKALKMIKEMTKKNLFEIMNEARKSDNPFLEPETFLKIAYCGLKTCDKDIKLEEVEEILDKGNYAEIFFKISEASLEAYGLNVEDKEQLKSSSKQESSEESKKK